MKKSNQSVILEWIGLSMCIGAVMVLAGVYGVSRLMNPEVMQDDISLLNAVRSDNSQLFPYYLILLGFCAMATGAYGLAADGFGLLTTNTGSRQEHSPGTKMLSLILLATVPLFGSFAVHLQLTDGPVFRAMAALLLDAELDPDILAIGIATVKQTNLGLFVWTVMFWTGVIPIIMGILGRKLGTQARYTGIILIVGGLVSLVLAMNGGGVFVNEVNYLSPNNEQAESPGAVFGLMFVGLGVAMITMIPFGWSIRSMGKARRAAEPSETSESA